MTRIRIATLDDAAAIAAIYAPAVIDSSTSFEIEAPAADEMARRVAAILAFTPWLVCEEDAQVVGYAYASKHRDRAAYQWSVEVSAYVRADRQRRGVAASLYTALFDVLRLQGFRNAYAGITLPNPGSVALHTKLGFERIGVFEKIGYKAGAWHDVLWLHREIAPRSTAPQAPIPLPAMIGHPELDSVLSAGSVL